MKALVTGGAGFIGSRMVKALVRGGHRVIVVDNLTTGHRDAIDPGARFVEADIRDRTSMTTALRAYDINAIFHFAGRSQVAESIRMPRLYWYENVVATASLLALILDAFAGRDLPSFVFSSSAAVYGNGCDEAITEDCPKEPTNPYGQTKLSTEHMLADYGRAYGLPWVALRYFNAVGPGERHDPETHLVPIAIDAAMGKRPRVAIFGTNYETPDGTCVRDYVHVDDLVEGHIAAFEYLKNDGESAAFNLGTGRGHSVREVIATVERITGQRVPVVEAERRRGDPASLVASAEQAEQLLGWKAKRTDLGDIVRSAIEIGY